MLTKRIAVDRFSGGREGVWFLLSYKEPDVGSWVGYSVPMLLLFFQVIVVEVEVALPLSYFMDGGCFFQSMVWLLGQGGAGRGGLGGWACGDGGTSVVFVVAVAVAGTEKGRGGEGEWLFGGGGVGIEEKVEEPGYSASLACASIKL